jgi:hypothetical protein
MVAITRDEPLRPGMAHCDPIVSLEVWCRICLILPATEIPSYKVMSWKCRERPNGGYSTLREIATIQANFVHIEGCCAKRALGACPSIRNGETKESKLPSRRK